MGVTESTSLKLEKMIWKDKKSNIVNPEAFSKVSERLAYEISSEGGKNKNRPSQLRKFYDSILNLNQRAKTTQKDSKNWKITWNSILMQLHRQLALVHYAKGRGNVTDKFVRMMEELINSVNTPEDLDVITHFLEAFMAFYKEYRPKD
ncbi:type III-A CRISPR-associated protein Csm2 [Desulfurobacterium sp.]|uniref:type III-A CRISPR-associated protein Csm2 n=1 Tax=Desulfurobacterium sp. TaxID=2004706 RepID=UPI0026066142|nr:type III-A CRISPR-associated protein Csm2 [Desulfurobacterium sp.]